MTRKQSAFREFRIVSDGKKYTAQWRWLQPKWYQRSGWKRALLSCRNKMLAEIDVKDWICEDQTPFEVPFEML